MRHSLGIVNKKDESFSVEGMLNHNFGVIITLMLTISQCIYSILYAFDKEIGLPEYEKKYDLLLKEFLEKGKEVLENIRKIMSNQSEAILEDNLIKQLYL